VQVRVLVIGGAGFIGTAACKELMRRGVETIATGRKDRPYGTFTSYRMLDRDEPGRLAAVLAEVEPDAVLDLACSTRAQGREIVETFQGRRYVLVSCLLPEAGQEAEGEVRASKLPWVVVRLPRVVGAGDPSRRSLDFAEAGGGDEPLVWVRDAGYGLALACDLHKDIEGAAFTFGWEPDPDAHGRLGFSPSPREEAAAEVLAWRQTIRRPR
jgi:nucleoside-diphosphate-sugar epimerase